MRTRTAPQQQKSVKHRPTPLRVRRDIVEFGYRIYRPIRRTVIISLGILEKNNDECILILVIYWKKRGLLHTKISNHSIMYSP